MKIIGLAVFIFGLVAVLATYDDLTPFWFNKKNEKIETLWKQDLELLVRTGSLPKQWTQISEIRLFPLSESTKKLVKEIKMPFRQHPEGDYLLEISLDDWQENQDYGIVVQYNLINKTTGNTIWELGRTIILN